MCRITPYDPTVKALFEETELSQREAAARLGVSPALVNQLLNRGTLPKTGWAGLKKGLASLLEERGAQAALVDYSLGKLEKLAEDEDTPAGDTAESEEPMILKKQTLTMKARQAFNMVETPSHPHGKPRTSIFRLKPGMCGIPCSTLRRTAVSLPLSGNRALESPRSGKSSST